jgi:hypothetical protein
MNCTSACHEFPQVQSQAQMIPVRDKFSSIPANPRSSSRSERSMPQCSSALYPCYVMYNISSCPFPSLLSSQHFCHAPYSLEAISSCRLPTRHTLLLRHRRWTRRRTSRQEVHATSVREDLSVPQVDGDGAFWCAGDGFFEFLFARFCQL